MTMTKPHYALIAEAISDVRTRCRDGSPQWMGELYSTALATARDALIAAGPAAEITETMAEKAVWQTIESAPRDRLRILSRWSTEDEPLTRMFWASHGEWSARWGRWRGRVEPSGLADPTHWMPILAPPAAQ
jgi:hypothetical protein